MDRERKGKGSNDDWTHPDDPDARITKMKDGRTHLAHKAEHSVDLETGAVVGVTVQPADRGDTQSIEETLDETLETLAVVLADEQAARVLGNSLMQEAVTDKGYHSGAVLEMAAERGIRTYISEPKRGRRRWKDKGKQQSVTYANRRRIGGVRGKQLAKLRAEKVERSNAHCYETGAMRRAHLRGHENIRKRLLVHVGGFDLGLVMRAHIGVGTPRGLQGIRKLVLIAISALLALVRRLWAALTPPRTLVQPYPIDTAV